MVLLTNGYTLLPIIQLSCDFFSSIFLLGKISSILLIFLGGRLAILNLQINEELSTIAIFQLI